MSYPQQVEVDPPRLKAISAEVGEAATLLNNARSSAEGQLAPTGQDGWASAGAARSGEQVWLAFLGTLGASVSGLASDLGSAADGYADSDQAAANRLGTGRNRPI